MFRRLRLQLTAICAAGTGLVLVGMAAVSLGISLNQLERQAGQAFDSSVNTVLFHLRTQPVVDQYWLTQIEADNGLWIRVESGEVQAQFTRQDPRREQLTGAALSRAVELDFRPDSVSGPGGEPETLVFEWTEAGDAYFGCVAYLPRDSGLLTVTVVGDRSADRALANRLRAGFAACVLAAVALLVAFAWVFSGRATRPVEESHRRQTAFVSAASHELRSPLTVIEMSAGTIRALPDRATGLAGKIEEECRRMARLLSDLLFLASADSGSSISAMAAVSPKTVLLSVMERYEPLAGQKGIRLSLEMEPDLPAVFCDRQMVEQVLSIFLDNALRFAAGGEILLRGFSQWTQVCLSVADSGPGVPEEERGRIFDRFYRSDAARTDKEHYGLGLSIAAEIAAHHRSKLSVRTGSLGGAEFLFPLRRA